MKKLLSLLLCICCLFCLVAAKKRRRRVKKKPQIDTYKYETFSSTTPLKIVHPSNGSSIPYVESSFVFGSADPKGLLNINGSTVSIHQGGGFLAMVDYSTGPFLIRAELTMPNTVYAEQIEVTVREPYTPMPEIPVEIKYIKPDINISLNPGEIVQVVCVASPKAEAYFQIEGVKGKFPMIGGGGFYKGSYIVKEGDKLKDSRIRVTLHNKRARRKVKKYSKGKLNIFDQRVPEIVEVTKDHAVIRAGPHLSYRQKAGYMLFPPVGTQLRVIGYYGHELKVYLTKNRYGWISLGEVRTLKKGAPIPRLIIENISVIYDEPETIIQIPFSKKIPFEITPSQDRRYIDLTFFGAVSNTDWIIYKSTPTAVEEIRWFQDDFETYRMRIFTKDKSWTGYDTHFDGYKFNFELRAPAKKYKKSILENIKIAIDPGHSPDKGAVGPTGLCEKDANWWLAEKVEKLLLKEGAEVIMTRRGTEEVGLYERPARAIRSGANVLVSIHNNALPEGKNPFERNGYGVYYFYSHSLPLAREMAEAFKEKIGIKARVSKRLNDDGIYFGNLALARVYQMPTVILEPTYIMIPEEEALLKNEKFQENCAKAIVSGLKKYFKKFRK